MQKQSKPVIGESFENDPEIKAVDFPPQLRKKFKQESEEERKDEIRRLQRRIQDMRRLQEQTRQHTRRQQVTRQSSREGRYPKKHILTSYENNFSLSGQDNPELSSPFSASRLTELLRERETERRKEDIRGKASVENEDNFDRRYDLLLSKYRL